MVNFIQAFWAECCKFCEQNIINKEPVKWAVKRYTHGVRAYRGHSLPENMNVWVQFLCFSIAEVFSHEIDYVENTD